MKGNMIMMRVMFCATLLFPILFAAPVRAQEHEAWISFGDNGSTEINCVAMITPFGKMEGQTLTVGHLWLLYAYRDRALESISFMDVAISICINDYPADESLRFLLTLVEQICGQLRIECTAPAFVEFTDAVDRLDRFNPMAPNEEHDRLNQEADEAGRQADEARRRERGE